jgi:hypothetical protein
MFNKISFKINFKISKLSFAILGMTSWLSLFAFPCTYTLVKDTCWADYEVNISVYDVMDSKPMFSVAIPKGKTWMRHEMDCKFNQSINYSATFSPAIWKGRENEVFHATRTWTLPKKVKPGDSAWEIRLCFPRDFAKVPLPPTATANCVCDYKSVPVIPPAQLPYKPKSH